MRVTVRNRWPFGQTLRALMKRRKVTFRELSARLDGEWGYVWLHNIASGKRAPSVELMLAIAWVFDVQPEVFVEYRQHLAATEAARVAQTVPLEDVLAALRALK